jgi:hypothetical protein
MDAVSSASCTATNVRGVDVENVQRILYAEKYKQRSKRKTRTSRVLNESQSIENFKSKDHLSAQPVNPEYNKQLCSAFQVNVSNTQSLLDQLLGIEMSRCWLWVMLSPARW